MAIKLEVNGNHFPLNDDQEKIHGVNIGDDLGIAWSDETNKLKIVRYTEDPNNRYDLLETLQIKKNQEVSKKITFMKDGLNLTADIIIRNK